MRRISYFVAFALASVVARASADEETLPPLAGDRPPQTIEEIWGDFDPRQEPIEAEILKEWDDGGIDCRIVRYRIGVFKGKKAMMAGIYAFPRGGVNLPGLVQVHGGGQSANLNAATTNARRGYACLSLNWGGNQLNDGNYRKIWDFPGTDWGAVDGTHPPQRDPINHFAVLTPNEFTIDPIESPRNSAWLLVAIGVRRALTFLEQQPEVDGEKLGVYGHSMGGKLTVLTAALDNRVKAAVPSCGGISDYPSEQHWENSKYCRRLACPTLFLNPVNDFYGKADDLNRAVELLPIGNYRFACAPNLDHRDLAEHFVCGPLWFDERLKGATPLPQTPVCVLDLKTPHGVPSVAVTADVSRPVRSIDVYYTQQVRDERHANPCWRHVAARQANGVWSAELPLGAVDRSLRVYANVRYPLEAPVEGAGYYYGLYTATDVAISSPMLIVTAEALREAGVKATDEPSFLIEDFGPDWQRGWYVFNEDGSWPYRTNKLQDAKWQGPSGAKLVLEVRSDEPNSLVLQVDDHAFECQLSGGADWQTITASSADFVNAAGDPLADWSTASELAIAERAVLRKNGQEKRLGAAWRGALPEFRRLRWELASP